MELGLELNWKALWVCVLAIVTASCLRAQDITGNWQGTIKPPQGQPLRMILHSRLPYHAECSVDCSSETSLPSFCEEPVFVKHDARKDRLARKALLNRSK
jgi:hypothetical protein